MNRRYLISRLSALGDVVCSLPVAVALKRTWPDCEVVWVVDERFAEVVECCTAVDRVVAINRKEGHKALDVLRGERFDAALDIQGLLKSAMVLAKVKADQKLGFHWQREGAGLFSRRVLPDPTSLHVVDQYVDVARAAGADMNRAEFDLVPDSGAVERAQTLLTTHGLHASKPDIATLNAGAGWASKRWPPAHFAVLANGLFGAGLTPVFVGGPGLADREAFQQVLDAGIKCYVDLIGQTSVAELIALISLSRAHVGGDTGSSHIAAALGRPAIGLYSRTRPERSCPYGQIERCHYDRDSMADIRPQEVLATMLEAVR